MNNYDPIRIARKSSDLTVLIITIIIALLFFVFLADQRIQLFYIGMVLMLVILFYIRLYQISFLAGALRVQNSRHAYMAKMVAEISVNLKMPYVDVFITQDPYLNAFALGYTHPFTIVLHSATVDGLTEAEVRAVLVHEMGHIKYKHTMISAYLTPFTQLIPFIGPFSSWLFGFWSRRSELTADRLALAYTRDPHTVAMALIKVHVGANYAQYMEEQGVLYQEHISHGTMRKLAQSLQGHPFLVTRIQEILKYSQIFGINNPQLPPQHPQTTQQQVNSAALN